MRHLLVVANFVAFGSGVVTATLAYLTYRESRQRYLHHFFHNVYQKVEVRKRVELANLIRRQR